MQKQTVNLKKQVILPSSGLGVLAPDAQAPVRAETAVVPDLLEPLKVIAHMSVNGSRGKLRRAKVMSDSVPCPHNDLMPRPSDKTTLVSNLGEPSGLVVLLPVQEPVRDLVLAGVGNDGHQTLELLSRALAWRRKVMGNASSSSLQAVQNILRFWMHQPHA